MVDLLKMVKVSRKNDISVPSSNLLFEIILQKKPKDFHENKLILCLNSNGILLEFALTDIFIQYGK